MTKFTRIITLILALIMVCAILAACGEPVDDDPPVTTTAAGNNDQPSDTTNPADPGQNDNVDEKGFIKDSLGDDLDFGKKDANILYWSDVERDEFTSDGITGDNILDGIYERNLAIEERLKVKLNFIGELGNNSKINNFVQKVEKSTTAGDKGYDIIATYSRTAAQLAIKGQLANLNNIDDSYIDYDKPWWPESIIDTMGVGNALYYVSGDASTNTLHFMYTIYYNKDLLEQNGLEDPTVYVEGKKWTIEKLIEMTANSYADLDGSGTISAGDKFGFCTIYYGVDAFYTGSGLKLVERLDDDNLIKISDDLYSEKTVKLIGNLGNWLTTSACYVDGKDSTGSCTSGNNYAPFVEGNCLFAQNRVYLADNKHASGLNSVEWKYGLVPTPLYDEAQENYVTVIGNPFTLYGIVTNCDKKSMMTAVLECWGSEAYRRTTPAIFETNMKYKYTELDISAKMFDILRETSSFDQGRIYSNTLGPYISEIPSQCACIGQEWGAVMGSYKKSFDRQLKSIISSFQKITDR